MPTVPATTHILKKVRSTRPKVFQCTGYGDCRMVFTRSEHLARHTRKHTGEKPYLCIMPGCTRKFSRFDNMMQHTQTHKLARTKTKGSKYEPESTPEFASLNDSSDEGSQKCEKMSLSQLCQTSISSPPLLKELHLTQDEFEALQGFGRFKHTPIFIDSFRDLASVVYIEPNPIRN
ncbi:uncharacterized protein B0P05DRAFT_522501 [Gilbertella persicaria]|uniref:uncharacterized protein n=1 Tax=Gilbertella persicaria TaxID=101096 RepID=UPI00221E5D9D|nr:uncharacterized protein B0P05DRAFT_522501 [Gilbertella persicaria]KAI8097887.1 hypothetical protein B0P05DRAFT_522501 [Gilbertella persicaria]